MCQVAFGAEGDEYKEAPRSAETFSHSRSSIFDEKSRAVWLEIGARELKQSITRLRGIFPEGPPTEECESGCKQRAPVPPTGPVPAPRSGGGFGYLTPEQLAALDKSLAEFQEKDKDYKMAKSEGDELAQRELELNKRISPLKRGEKELAENVRRLKEAKADYGKQIKPEEDKLDKVRKELDPLEKELKGLVPRLEAARNNFYQVENQWIRLREARHANQKRLIDHYIETGPRSKIDFLVSTEIRTPLRVQLLRAVQSGNMKRARELLEVGADVFQNPGEYSAAAFADIFGHKRMASLLRKNGAWIAVPWDPFYNPTKAMLIKALNNQYERLIRLSDSIASPHDFTKQLINDLKCQIDCLDRRSAERDI